MPDQKKSPVLYVCLALVIGLALLYGRVSKHEFMCYDDSLYVTGNAYVQDGLTMEGLKWAFFNAAGEGTYWHPVTWISHMLDAQIFGANNSGKQHLVNVAFHMANAVLLFLLLFRMTKTLWPSAAVAALFAFHPLQVDSVAWIAERKNVLSTFFWLLTTLAYVRYVELWRIKSAKAKAAYALTFVLFAIGLMCKPMLVTLPCTLLLLDFWPLFRWSPEKWRTTGSNIPKGYAVTTLPKLIVEKLPLLGLSIVSSIITIKAHEQLGMIQDEQNVPLLARLANSIVGYATYLRKMWWPADLAIFYPLPQSWPSSTVAIAALVVVALTVAALWFARKQRAVVVGWLWFLGTLVPVIGILQVHDQAMADRFVYVPMIGVCIAVAWGLYTLNKQAFFAVCGLAVFACLPATSKEVSYWRDCETMMSHSADVTKGNYIAYNNLGQSFEKEGRMQEAMNNYKMAIEAKYEYPMAHSNLGVIYAKMGNLEAAMNEFQIALKQDPDYADALSNAGHVYMIQQRWNDAIEQFKHAIRVRPSHANSHDNLGTVYLNLGRIDDAIEEFRTAAKYPPVEANTLNNLGVALAKKKQYGEAISVLQQAVHIDPRNADSESKLGYVLELSGNTQEAIMHYTAALNLQPNHPDARKNLQRLTSRAQAGSN